MRKRLIQKFTKSKEGTLGYTLTEMLVVIAIIAILVAIAIPSVVAISRALKFKRLNDHAKSIFMAAQQTLTDMRSDGDLKRLQGTLTELELMGAKPIPNNAADEQLRETVDESGEVQTYVAEYNYTASTFENQGAFNLILPVGSVDATVLNEQVIIEYNPITGNVFAVFYSEEDKDIVEAYPDGLPRDKSTRKEWMLGYYDGSKLNSTKLEWQEFEAEIEYVNGEEGIVEVRVPVTEELYGSMEKFARSLEVVLTITSDDSLSENSNLLELLIKDTSTGLGDNCEIDYDRETGNPVVVVSYPIDSLVQHGSFANIASGTHEGPAQASLTTLKDESVFSILPGENITIQADITVDTDISEDLVTVEPCVATGINPLFESLTYTEDGYQLVVANGRHLQNLNVIAPTLADQVIYVVFEEDIDWNETVTYYNKKYAAGDTYHTGTPIYEKSVITGYRYDESPARALPYFVPIHNASLFGTATFIYPGDGDGGMGSWLQQLLSSIGEVLFGGFNNANVPTLTDELDFATWKPIMNENQKRPEGEKYPQYMYTHAEVQGGNHAVYNLNIDSTKYAVPSGGKFYTNGQKQKIDYNFTGLFGYVNTPVSGLRIVNPVVKGVAEDAGSRNNPATGALVGAAGYNTVILDCSVYVDKTAPGRIDDYLMGQKNYNETAAQTWYGVSGEGAVGGLVGYAKSHYSVTGYLADESVKALAFNRCFAAVPVSGNMRSNTEKDYGYSRGVGGFIGNSQLTNFYKCYASGDVLANGCLITDTWVGEAFRPSDTSERHQEAAKKLFGATVELLYNGRKSWGAGGFVGTSHGTRYTNCFATGDVTGTTSGSIIRGAGGFVGFMSLDETSKYGNNNAQVAQRTIFTECYAVGLATTKQDGTTNAVRHYENFSGANGRIVLDLYESLTYFIGDYYRLYAPYKYYQSNREPAYGDSFYIYRDTYYLNYNSLERGEPTQSRTCANPTVYEYLQNMVECHSTSKFGKTWQGQIIEEITSIPILKYMSYGTIFGNYNKRHDRYNLHPDRRMENLYYNELREGFSTNDWGDAATTHPYTTAAGGATYPFPMIKYTTANGETRTMDYYGDWPSKPSDMGIAYYEGYERERTDDETGEVTIENYTRYLYDRERDVDDLRLALDNGKDVVLKKDGYAIFSKSAATLYVTIGDETIFGNKPFTLSTSDIQDTFKIDGSEYVAFPFTEEMMEYAEQVFDAMQTMDLADNEKFYVKVTATHLTGATYTMYFNPLVASSQVNTTETDETPQTATLPTTAPSIMYIRSARQFKAMSKMGAFWDAGYRYVQQLNIDAINYDGWNSVDDYKLNSIGNATTAFNASYSAAYTNDAGITQQYYINGFTLNNTASGIFGVIGPNGGLDNVILNTGPISMMASTAYDVGVVAGRNEGKISNVDLYVRDVETDANGNQALIDGAVSLTSAQPAADSEQQSNAGALIGYSSGSVENCEVNVGAVTLVANNCGGLIGGSVGTTAKDAEIAESKLTMSGALTANNASVTQHVGGLVGYGENLNLTGTDPMVSFNGWVAASVNNTTYYYSMRAQANYAGGLAGYLKNAIVKATDVENQVAVGAVATLNNAKTGGYMAGFLGGGENVTVSAVDVLVDSLSGNGAAGFLGNGSGIIASACDIAFANSNSTITGGAQAAGVACSITSATSGGSGFSNVSVTLTGVTVYASSGDAAGFAVVAAGDFTACHVKLGGDAAITGASRAAGYACDLSGYVLPANGEDDTTHNSVMGAGNITAPKAAGFACNINAQVIRAHVTPAAATTKEAYLAAQSNSTLKVTGTSEAAGGTSEAAGFALSVSANALVKNCYALGEIRVTKTDGLASGFVNANRGTIDSCMANVNLRGGHAFVAQNTDAESEHKSLVSRCYGWYTDMDSENNPVSPEVNGVCESAYFVKRNAGQAEVDTETGTEGGTEGEPEEQYSEKSVTLYPADGSGAVTMTVLQLQNATDLLNSTKYMWYSGEGNDYPYSADLSEESYVYPRLGDHYGDWLGAPRHSFGLAYYETYVDNTEEGSNSLMKIHVVDLSIADRVVEDSIDEPYLTIENGTVTTSTKNIFNNEGEIAEFGYMVFGHKDNFVLESLCDPDSEPEAYTLDNGVAYDFYRLNPAVIPQNGVVEAESVQIAGNGVAYINTLFADAVNTTSDIYYVRTAEQLAQIGTEPTATFRQTHSITIDTFATVDSFGGNYHGNYSDDKFVGTMGEATLTVTDQTTTWMTEISNGGASANSGRVESVDLILSAGATKPVFGMVEGVVNQVNVESAGANIEGGGILANQVDGMVEYCDINVTGEYTASGMAYSISAGTAGGTKTGTAAGVLTGNNYGTLTGNVVTIDTLNASGTAVGGLTGNNEGTLTGNTVDVTTMDMTNAVAVEVAGGLTGINGQAGELSGNTVSIDDLTTNIRNAAVGGLVGANGGDINGDAAETGKTQVDVKITYTGEGDITIGGIVGQMLAGTLKDIKATGSINVTSETEQADAENIIGGAVGEIIGGSVGEQHLAGRIPTYVNTSVTVDDEWAGAADVNEDADTFGDTGIDNNGPVGMFVGYTEGITFTNCSSTAANSTYQFVGEAAWTLVEGEDGLWYSDVQVTDTADKLQAYSDTNLMDDGGYLAKNNVPTEAVMYASTEGFKSIRAVFDQCTFYFGNDILMQTYGVDNYYYTMASHKENTYTIGGTPAVPTVVSKDDNYTRAQYNGRGVVNTYKYYYDQQSGKYYPASIEYTEKSGFLGIPYDKKFIITETGTGAYLDEFSASIDLEDETLGSAAQITLYEITPPTLNGLYVAIDDNGNVLDIGDGTTEPRTDSFFEQRDPEAEWTWYVQGATIQNSRNADEIYESTVSFLRKDNTNLALYKANNQTFYLYPVAVSPNSSSYDVLVFTYVEIDNAQRQCVSNEDVGDVPVTTELDETDPAGETGGETQNP